MKVELIFSLSQTSDERYLAASCFVFVCFFICLFVCLPWKFIIFYDSIQV